jgi:ferredoxin-NADP reductase
VRWQRESGEVVSLVWAPIDSTPLPDYLAGQYAVLDITTSPQVGVACAAAPPAPLQRCYTITQIDRVGAEFTISVKLHRGGRASTLLHSAVSSPESCGVLLRGFDGSFSCLRPDGTPRSPRLLFCAGGIGITPVLAMLRSLSGCALALQRVVVLFSTQTLAGAPFLVELAALVSALPQGRLVVSTTRDSDTRDTHLLPSTVTVVRGRLTAELVMSACAGETGWCSVVCGPEGFMQSTRAHLTAAGCEDVLTESFAY